MDDKNSIIEAVKYFGFPLCYASNRLKKDKEVVLTALKTYSGAI